MINMIVMIVMIVMIFSIINFYHRLLLLIAMKRYGSNITSNHKNHITQIKIIIKNTHHKASI